MSTNTMKGVGVVPSKKELRLVAHPEPKIAAANELKIRTLEVGICGTDREICTFAYGHGPTGCDYLVLGHECLGEVTEVGAGREEFQGRAISWCRACGVRARIRIARRAVRDGRIFVSRGRSRSAASTSSTAT